VTRTCNSLALALAGLLLDPAPAAAATSELKDVAWRTAGGTAELVLRFAGAPPGVSVRVEAWGLDLIVPGIEAVPTVPSGIKAARETGGFRVALDRPGARLLGVQYGPDTVVLAVGGADAAPADDTYRIGPGDVVVLSVYKNPDLGGDLTVAPDGTVTVPLVGPVQARGRTEAELTEAIRNTLAENLLVDPQVSLSVKAYQSQFAYVSGSVVRGERVALRPGMTLKDVLGQAGVALAPGQEVLLTRAGNGGSARLLSSEEVESDHAPNPADGDTLTVQERRYVILHGEVKRPGRIAIRPGMTLLEAIAAVEGLTDWASKKDARILRKDETSGGSTEILVNLKDVESGRTPDPEIKPGDVVTIRRRFL
jgi:polysaccharide export outer membrane protein